MTHVDAIMPHMAVVASDGGEFAMVEGIVRGDTIRLVPDATGLHHYIPVSWVTAVDTRVHVDRPRTRAMSDWSTSGDPADEDPLHVERVRSQQG